MTEADIINYRPEFRKSMDEGGWNLSKVDMKKMKESTLTLVFGKMNETPEAPSRVAHSGLTVVEYFRDGVGQGRGG